MAVSRLVSDVFATDKPQRSFSILGVHFVPKIHFLFSLDLYAWWAKLAYQVMLKKRLIALQSVAWHLAIRELSNNTIEDNSIENLESR